MNILKQATSGDTTADEDILVEYLQAHPDFFERHPGLLADLRLPHQAGGAAVSLVERQVSVLRQDKQRLERKLHDLIEVARSNDELAGKLHRLALELMHRNDPAAIVDCIEEQLRLSFSADQSVLVLFGQGDGLDETRFLRVLARDDPRLAPFRTFLESGTARCGRVRDTQRDFLFGEANLEIASVALLPLGPDAHQGFLAIGSRDADHFHPGKSMDFLNQLGELVGCALQPPPDD
ncbi:MAG TPA: DUF484 family protein [Chromatiales bacterium]|nr:DUF484 family protein [Chromatiales bacterium]